MMTIMLWNVLGPSGLPSVPSQWSQRTCLMGLCMRCLLISLAFQLLCMVVSLEEFWWFDELG